ncbi:uncharacterized protein LOC110464266 [Mizuhopecten yessoensis]|uniref:NF-kappa-B inhibitor zeta n=1 Tax=Mizuhopecten yessoensis TaxID=6573 RepID=A0A210PU90_MIZYE|nr:uncharacterized protein LOC110464266 [Mizuhopecten yessoensis]OWF40053.1 NF-kappa-B inhibitor zeta [Mizuhopecten yessoensis]
MTGIKERATNTAVEEKQGKAEMAPDMSSKYENDGDVENLANNLSALTIKREAVEDNELPESPTNPESSPKGEKSSRDYETKESEVKKEIVAELPQEGSAFLTRGPTNGHATTNSVQHMGYNKAYGLANAQTFKDKKRGLEDDGNDPPLRYLRPVEDQYSSLTKDKSSLGMMVVKSPSTDIPQMNFPSFNQDDIIEMAYQANNNGQFNMSCQTHSFNHGLFSQTAFQSHQTTMGQTVNGNINVMNNQQPRPKSIEQQQMYGRCEAYTSESESESAKSPYSDQMYSPDSSSVKSINSPPPSNMSNDSGIIGDLTVNSPLGNASPQYDTAIQNGFTQWDDQSHQGSPGQVSNHSMASPPHISYSPGMPPAGSPMMQQAGSPMMQQAGSPLMQQAGSPMMQQVGSPMMQQAGSPLMQQAGSPIMPSVSSCLAANAIPQQSRPNTMVSSQQICGSLGIPNLVPTQSNSGAPLMTPQQLVNNQVMVSSVPYTSQTGAPLMMSQMPGQMGMSHTGPSLPHNVTAQLTSQQLQMPPITMEQMMSANRQQNVQYMSSQTNMAVPQVSASQQHLNDELNKQIDEKELSFVMEVLADDIIESNMQNKMKNQICNKRIMVPSAAPQVHQNIATSQPVQPIPQNRNLMPSNKPPQNIQPGPNVMTTVQTNQHRIPVTLVTNNMIPVSAPMHMNSKLQVTKAATTQVLPQQPISHGQMVFMPPGNQVQTTANTLQTTGNVVQPPMIIIVPTNMNQTTQIKPQPTKVLKKILPKPGTTIPDSSKPTTTAPAMSRNLNETGGPGGRPVIAKPGQTQQTLMRQNMLNMARRTVADISRDRLRFQDDEGDTYLHVAVCKTDASMVQALIERLWREKLEVMIDAPNKKRQTPLYLAVAANQPMMVNSLVARNANPCSMAQVYSNDGKSREVKAPLHVASSNGQSYLSTLQELIKSAAINLNIVNSEGHTALHCAILAHRRQNKNGEFIDSIPIIETLLKAGADPNSQDKKNGKTPLMYAIEKRDIALVERMLNMFDSGAKLRNIIKSQTFDGSTCIKIAEGLKAEFQPDIWQRLINTLNAALNG